MKTVADYVSRIEGTCGAEKDIIVVLRNEKKEEAISNIMMKATLKHYSRCIFELTYKNHSFRLLMVKADFRYQKKDIYEQLNSALRIQFKQLVDN